ncbi:MAG: hypothetical protein AAGD14_06175, partial [Planctomycetota bacterium]
MRALLAGLLLTATAMAHGGSARAPSGGGGGSGFGVSVPGGTATPTGKRGGGDITLVGMPILGHY